MVGIPFVIGPKAFEDRERSFLSIVKTIIPSFMRIFFTSLALSSSSPHLHFSVLYYTIILPGTQLNIIFDLCCCCCSVVCLIFLKYSLSLSLFFGQIFSECAVIVVPTKRKKAISWCSSHWKWAISARSCLRRISDAVTSFMGEGWNYEFT